MKIDIDVIEDGMRELMKLKYFNLSEAVAYLSDGSCRLKANFFPCTGGVYAFWLTGALSDFMDQNVNRSF